MTKTFHTESYASKSGYNDNAMINDNTKQNIDKYAPTNTSLIKTFNYQFNLIFNFRLCQQSSPIASNYRIIFVTQTQSQPLTINNNIIKELHRMESSPKTITCPNPDCGSKLKKTGSAYVRCANCRTAFFSFCHEFPNRTFEYVTCKKCPNELYYFFCVKCKGALCFKNYRMGSVSKCKCGFDGCYVVCNNCKEFECYPPNKSYEGVPWCCTKCSQPFNFMTCGGCFRPHYSKTFNINDKIKCLNSKCGAQNKVKACKECSDKFLDNKNKVTCTRCEKKSSNSLDKLKIFNHSPSSQSHPLTPPPPNNNQPQPSFQPEKAKLSLNQHNQPIQHQNNHVPQTQPQTQTAVRPAVTPTQTIEKSFGKQIESLCKICLDRPADYINTRCFHMCCCGVCVDSMNNTCPICRTEGQFHKVFR